MRPGDQDRHRPALTLEAFAHGQALLVPGVDSLEYHRELEVPERHVIPDPGHVAAGQLGVPGSELGPAEEARLSRDPCAHVDVQPSAVIAGVRPVGQGQAEIGQRVSERGHLPVHHGRDPRRLAEHHQRVVQPEVAVHQSAVRRLRQPSRQPGDQFVVAGHLPGIRQLPLPLPAIQLASQVALRPAEVTEPDSLGVHGVNRRHHPG